MEIRNEKLSNKFWATASIMAAYYEILNVSSNWLIKKGINKTIANNYISELFLSLSQDEVNKKSLPASAKLITFTMKILK